MNYIFKFTPYNKELLPQVSKALETRTELISRERYADLWNITDKLNRLNQGRTRSRLRTRVMSIICLLLGIFLFVPGIVEPQELMIPLLVGAVAIGAGIGGLWRSRKNKKNPFDKSAELFLKDRETALAEKIVEVSFLEEGMEILVENEKEERVEYSKFECVIETLDAYLLVYEEKVLLLQKMDLITGVIEDFSKFLSERIVAYQDIK